MEHTEMLRQCWRIIDAGIYHTVGWHSEGTPESGPSGGSYAVWEDGSGNTVEGTSNGSVMLYEATTDHQDFEGGRPHLVYNSGGGSPRSARALGEYMKQCHKAGGDPHDVAMDKADKRRDWLAADRHRQRQGGGLHYPGDHCQRCGEEMHYPSHMCPDQEAMVDVAYDPGLAESEDTAPAGLGGPGKAWSAERKALEAENRYPQGERRRPASQGHGVEE